MFIRVSKNTVLSDFALVDGWNDYNLHIHCVLSLWKAWKSWAHTYVFEKKFLVSICISRLQGNEYMQVVLFVELQTTIDKRDVGHVLVIGF